MEPEATETAKPAGSSVGSIELQVRVSDKSQVGLKFVEKQGQIEIQLKSGDAQTARVLSDNLAGLKTSLNENGWNVEGRVQGSAVFSGQGGQNGAPAERGLSLLPSTELSSPASRSALNSPSAVADPPIREAGDRLGQGQPLRTEQVSIGQSSRQSGSDTSSGQDQHRSDRDGSPGRNGQQAREDGSGANSEQQGRRSVRDSEEWLESIENNLAQVSSRLVRTGETA
jgi:hypothetical protein